MTILFAEATPDERAFFTEKLSGHTLVFCDTPLTPEILTEEMRAADVLSVFIYTPVTDALIAALPSLRMVTTRSTGFDHIDHAACTARNIAVCNVPFYGENTVAEHTFALILALSRNVHRSHVRRLRNNFSIEGLQGFDLKGKVLGVIGGGHIGLHVVRIARGFGMRVLVTDVHQDTFTAEVLDFQYVPLEELLASSDIITVHVPYCAATHHLINEDNVKQIKRGALLINTARGELVDNDAIIKGLDAGILAGAGLDVLEGEALLKEEKQILHNVADQEHLAELIKDHIILGRDNVVYTPHIAFYSREALERIMTTTVQNIAAFATGKPKNCIAVPVTHQCA